jgi:CheY-like chemotaxis protein
MNMTTALEILIIDNDPFYQLVTKKLLSKSDLPFTTSAYVNGKEALDSLIEKNNSTIKKMFLLDLDMPIMDGWEFLEAYYNQGLDRNNDFCIYIVTSSIAQEDKNKAKSYPAVHGYLEKPLSFETINKVIDCCLKS